MVVSGAHCDRLGAERAACIGRARWGNGGRIGSAVRCKSSSPRLLLFRTFRDEGEWEVAFGQSIKVACWRSILKSVRGNKTERTLQLQTLYQKVKQMRIKESRKMGDRSKHQEGHGSK